MRHLGSMARTAVWPPHRRAAAGLRTSPESGPRSGQPRAATRPVDECAVRVQVRCAGHGAGGIRAGLAPCHARGIHPQTWQISLGAALETLERDHPKSGSPRHVRGGCAARAWRAQRYCILSISASSHLSEVARGSSSLASVTLASSMSTSNVSPPLPTAPAT